MNTALFAKQWIARAIKPVPCPYRLTTIHQDWLYPRVGQSVNGTPLNIAGHEFETGIGTHADSEIIVELAQPAVKICGFVGLDDNADVRAFLQTGAPSAKIFFSIESDGRPIWQSAPLSAGDPAVPFDVLLDCSKSICLRTRAVEGVNNRAHADWTDLQIETTDGQILTIGESQDSQRLPTKPIFSFLYKSLPFHQWISDWKVSATAESSDDGVTHHRIVYADPETGLTCTLELKEYKDFSAAEWVVKLRNDGSVDTPLIQNVQAIDTHWTATSTTRLHRSKGSSSQFDDFAYHAEALGSGETISMVAGGGRSSTNWLPFFNLETSGGGVITCIGWSGEWASTIQRTDTDDLVSITAGLAKTNFVLHPGEEMRTPSIALLFWQGKPIDGNNLLRRFLIAHHTPRHAGKTITAPMSSGMWGGQKTETQLEAIEMIEKSKLNYDVFWIDAGWYGTAESWSPIEFTGKWYGQAGNWNANPVAHPDGLSAVGDASHKAGLKFLLWFELERAVAGTSITLKHPDWFLTDPANGFNVLLNLGNDEALRWIIDFMSSRIDEWGIDIYRQDFNFEPLSYWRAADAPDRVGIAESKHIAGLYAFWDELLRRHPNLIIDNCASGGRRLDLETVGRSIPLWRSDYQCVPTCDPLGSQNHTAGLSYWWPISGTATHLREEDTYNFRSALSAAIGFALPPTSLLPEGFEYDWVWRQKMIAEYQLARPLFLGDYYPLTSFSTKNDAWFAFQMHRPDLDEGFVLAFRRSDSPYSSAQFELNGLLKATDYRISDADRDTERVAFCTDESGWFTIDIELKEPRSTRLLFYCGLK